MYPASTEFGLDKFWDLPYPYVLLAVHYGMKHYRKERHYDELGIAQLTAITINAQRQKSSDPVASLMDYCFWKDREADGDIPDSYYGSAAMYLIDEGLYPAWALFCFKQLKDSADPDYTPGFPALIADDAMLLHPVRTGKSWTGLLIAQESAGEQVRTFWDVEGNPIDLKVPKVRTKVIAEEGMELEVVS